MVKSKLPFSQIVLYSIGHLGYSLASFGVINLLYYFYMPPENGEEPIFPEMINNLPILGLFTILGFLTFGGRMFDAITDPLIASWSDKSQFKMGKRKGLMLIAALPFALLSFLIFYPLSMDVNTQTTYLLILVFLLYFFMTLYIVPYYALISELGSEAEDRLRLSTSISITWALGFIIGSGVYALKGMFMDQWGHSSTVAFQYIMAIYAGLSFLFLLCPALFLKEKEYAIQSSEYFSWKESIKAVYQNANFRTFVLADMIYWMAITFMQVGISYFVGILFGLEESYASLFLLISFLGSFLLYIPVLRLTRRRGKKKIILSAFIVFGAIFLACLLNAFVPSLGQYSFYLLAVSAAYPLAVFGILPNALIGDVVNQAEKESGSSQSAMYYGVRNMLTKFGISLTNLLFPSFLLLGKSMDQPQGVQLSAAVALMTCLAGAYIFTKFKEIPA